MLRFTTPRPVRAPDPWRLHAGAVLDHRVAASASTTARSMTASIREYRLYAGSRLRSCSRPRHHPHKGKIDASVATRMPISRWSSARVRSRSSVELRRRQAEEEPTRKRPAGRAGDLSGERRHVQGIAECRLNFVARPSATPSGRRPQVDDHIVCLPPPP